MFHIKWPKPLEILNFNSWGFYSLLIHITGVQVSFQLIVSVTAASLWMSKAAAHPSCAITHVLPLSKQRVIILSCSEASQICTFIRSERHTPARQSGAPGGLGMHTALHDPTENRRAINKSIIHTSHKWLLSGVKWCGERFLMKHTFFFLKIKFSECCYKK